MWIDVDEAGAQLGISPLDSRNIADLLVDEGWVTTHQIAGSLKLRMTKPGFDGVAKLRRPKVYRWLDAHPRLVNILLGILAALVTTLLTRLFWPVR